MTLNDIKKDAQGRMTKSVEGFRQELTKLRTGRASTALVDHLKVNYYGSDMPLSQVATVAVSDAPSLTATVATCRSEEHTSELQSRRDLVGRLLLEKKKKS